MKDYLCKKLFNRLSGTLVIRARCGNNITGLACCNILYPSPRYSGQLHIKEGDHKQILAALIKKDARAAKLAMWQHLENVKQRLLEFSNVDDIYFDGYLFDSWPLDKVDA